MKIRHGFVTNSSSSSFVVSLKDTWKDEYKDLLRIKEECCENCEEDNCECDRESYELDTCCWEYLTIENYKNVIQKWLICFYEVTTELDSKEMEYYFDGFKLPEYNLFRQLISESEFSDENYNKFNDQLNDIDTRDEANSDMLRKKQKELDNNPAYITKQIPYMVLEHVDGNKAIQFKNIYNEEYNKLNKEICDIFWENGKTIETERHEFYQTFIKDVTDKEILWKFFLLFVDYDLNGDSFEMLKFYLTVKERLEKGENLVFMEINEGWEEGVADAFAEYGTLVAIHHNR